MTDLVKSFGLLFSNPKFIQGLICGVGLFFVPKVVVYLTKRNKQTLKTKPDKDSDIEEDNDDDSFSDMSAEDEDENVEGPKDVFTLTKGDEMKLMLVVRTDLEMGKGKAAAQCAHAAVQAYRQASAHAKGILQYWCRHGQPKVVVKVSSEEELLKIAEEARKRRLITSLIRDAGRTQIESGSRTVLGIGPAPKSELDLVTGHLKLY